jgi:Acetyltransferase (GNAT) domain
MEVIVVKLDEDFLNLKPDWQRIESLQNYNLPFLKHEWVYTWWKSFRKNNYKSNDELRILVLKKSNQVIGIAPFFKTTYLSTLNESLLGSAIVPKMSLVRPLGADRNLTEFKTILCKEENESECYQAVLDYFYTVEKDWGSLQFSGVNRSSRRRMFNIPEFRVPLLESWDLMKSNLKKQTKKVLRNHVQTWKKAQFSPEFLVLTDTSKILESMPHFFELHKARAIGEGFGSNFHPDYFQFEHEKQFMLNVIEKMAGSVAMFAYQVDGKFICMRLGFVSGDSLYLYLSGYSPQIAKLSAMTEMIVETFKWSIARGLKEVNLSFGLDQSKTRWSPRVNNFLECYFEGPMPLSGVGYRFYDRLKLRKVEKTVATFEGFEIVVADTSDSE